MDGIIDGCISVGRLSGATVTTNDPELNHVRSHICTPSGSHRVVMPINYKTELIGLGIGPRRFLWRDMPSDGITDRCISEVSLESLVQVIWTEPSLGIVLMHGFGTGSNQFSLELADGTNRT